MKYSEIKIPFSTGIETVTFNNKEIKVKQSLSTNDIYDLMMITLQESKEDTIYNPVKLEAFFHVNLITMISDIEFEAEDRINKFDTFDELRSSGLLTIICAEFPNYKIYSQALHELAEKKEKYENSMVYLLSKVISDLPANAEAAAKIVEQFDPEQYQKVIDFARAANGGRPIKN